MTVQKTGFMVISCQMPELLRHADVSHEKYQSVPSNKCTSCSSSDLPRCQAAGTPEEQRGAAALGAPGPARGMRHRRFRTGCAVWGVGNAGLDFWEALSAPLVRRLVLAAPINPSGCAIRAGRGP